MKTSDVLIVGAGLSGLTAANELRQFDASLNVMLIEAGHEIGGRLKSENLIFPENEKMNVSLDLGGQFLPNVIFSGSTGHKQDVCAKQTFQLLDQLGIQTYTVPISKKPLIKMNEKWPLLGRMEFNLIVRKLEKLSKQIDPRFPFQNESFANEYDAITVKSYLDSKCYFNTSKSLINFKLKSILGQEISSISLLAFLNLSVSLGGVSKFLLGSKMKSEERICVKGGAKTICDRLLKKIGIQNVMLNQAVTSITTSPDNKVLVTTSSQQTFVASFVICTIPLNLVSNRIEFRPPLDAKLRFTLQNFLPGEMSKFFLVYKTKFWRKEKKDASKTSGEDFLMLADLREKENYLDKSPFVSVMECGIESEQGILMGFLSDFNSIEWSAEEEENLKTNIIENLTELTGNQSFLDLQYFIVKHWSEEPFCGSVFPSVGSMRYNETLRDVHGKIVFAGAETSSRWIGHIPGAIQSGQRAAIQTLDELRPQALSAQDYARLRESRLSPQERAIILLNKEKERMAAIFGNGKCGKKWHVYRWTFFLPLAGLAVAYVAISMREKYGKLLFPMPG